MRNRDVHSKGRVVGQQEDNDINNNDNDNDTNNDIMINTNNT